MKEEFDFYDNTNLKSYNLNETMRYQLNLLDSLDAYTRKHSENVASITCRLCEYLHLPTKFTIYCTTCAYLHDVGKLFIPSSILQKPARLTDEEYEIIKTHTTLGYNLCMKDKELRPYALGAKCHHEALNGMGYPEGLTDKEIPYEAKIIRVADEYDAIVSKRQYKSHIDISETLKILIENTEPVPNSVALGTIAQDVKLGKIDKKIVKALKKVIIDDVEYEIYCRSNYTDFLKEEIKRLEQVREYYNEMINAKNEKQHSYYEQGVKYYLKTGETYENFEQVLEEYKQAYVVKKEAIEKLEDEIKKIKKMKI